jgi:hypothetical protein
MSIAGKFRLSRDLTIGFTHQLVLPINWLDASIARTFATSSAKNTCIWGGALV